MLPSHRFTLAPTFTPEELRHQLLPREGVVDSFVVCDGDGKVTDLCSFYHLPSSGKHPADDAPQLSTHGVYNPTSPPTRGSWLGVSISACAVMKSPKHKTLFAAYSYYNVATTIPLDQLMKDNLIFAKVSFTRNAERRRREDDAHLGCQRWEGSFRC